VCVGGGGLLHLPPSPIVSWIFVFQECLPVRAGEGVAVWAGELMHSGHNLSNRFFI
jgi:hypothetical protein